jgi:hypothetical protein
MACVAVGCAGAESMGPVGVSPPRASEPAFRGAEGGAPTTSSLSADFRQRMMRASETFLSRGHGERFDATVWSSAADAGAGEGAIYLEDLALRDGGGAGGLLVMERRGAAWRFAAVGPDGQAVDDAGAQACEPCHREGRDGLFPWPSSRP